MNYWLMKSEPEAFSIDDLAASRVTGWDGVRNYQARNFMRSMKVGDAALFYHSNADPSALVGCMRIVKEAYADPTQFNPQDGHYDAGSSPAAPRWFQVDVRFEEKFKRSVTLEEIKKTPGLKDMVLLKRGRLSVQPVTPEQWSIIRQLAQAS